MATLSIITYGWNGEEVTDIEVTLGETIQLAATPIEGWVFDRWELQGVQLTDNPILFVIETEVTIVKVYFAEEPVPPNGDGNGNRNGNGETPGSSFPLYAAAVTGLVMVIDLKQKRKLTGRYSSTSSL